MTGSKPLAKKLARLAPRQEIEFYVDTQSRLTRLVHRLDRVRSLHVSRDGESFTFEEVIEPPEVSLATATGVIDSSLFEAGQRAGLSDNLIMQMAEIFGWDVDFALDIRTGDRFALVFEEQYKDGDKIGEGPIVAAEFINRGRGIRAVRYVDPTDRVDYFSARRAEHAKGIPAHAGQLHANQLAFQLQSSAPDSPQDASSPRRRLRGSERHRGQGFRRRKGRIRRAQGWIRTDGHTQARLDLHHALRTSRSILQGHSQGKAGRTGPDHRICREHRARHGPSPPLRVSCSRCSS